MKLRIDSAKQHHDVRIMALSLLSFTDSSILSELHKFSHERVRNLLREGEMEGVDV